MKRIFVDKIRYSTASPDVNLRVIEFLLQNYKKQNDTRAKTIEGTQIVHGQDIRPYYDMIINDDTFRPVRVSLDMNREEISGRWVQKLTDRL